MNSRVWGLALVAVLGLAAAPAARSSAQQTYALKRIFRVGEVDRYKTTLDIEGGGGLKLQLAMTTSEKTVEIKDDGTMVRAITVEGAEIVMNGQAMPMPGFKPTTMTSTFDKNGKAVKEEGQGGQFRQMLSMTRPTIETDRPLRVGEDWKTQVPTNKDGTKKLDVTVTLVGLEPKSDTLPADAYKVKTVAEGTVEAQQGDQKVRVETTSMVARDSGKPLRGEGTVTGVTLAQFGSSKITYKLVLLPEKGQTPR